MALKNFLEEVFSLEIHDLSHTKIVSVQFKIAELVSSINVLSNRLHSFMKDYRSSLNLLEPFLSAGSHITSDVVIGMFKSFSDLVNGCQPSIQRTLDQLIFLDCEYTRCCSRVPNTQLIQTNKASLVCKILEKDFLSDILEYLHLPPPIFIADLTEGDLFRSTCIIDIGRLSFTDESGLIHIHGESKHSLNEAETSATVNAINFLEMKVKFEVVDFNYDLFILLRQHHEVLLQLRSQYEDLALHARASWTDLTSSLQSFIDRQYNLSSSVFFSLEDCTEYGSILSFCNDLQQALYDLWNLQDNALSTISSSLH